MRVSVVKVTLAEEDVLSIIDEYLQIEGLKIDNIEIKEMITVRGNYKKKITIPFEVKIGLGNIYGNIINAKVFNMNVSKISVLRGIKNITLKKLFSDFSECGIKVDKDTVTIDLELISKVVPYFYFKLKNATIIERTIEVELEDVIYSEKKYKSLPVKDSELILNTRIKKDELLAIDGYSGIRKKIVNKVPDKYVNLVKYAMLIPDITALLFRLFRDKRVKIKVKMMVVGIMAYLASPIDILPNFIPIIGNIDSVAIAFFGINAIINEVPEHIILENWQGEENIILLTREAVSYISKIVGAQNVGKLIETLKSILKKVEQDPGKFKLNKNKEYVKETHMNNFGEEEVINEEDRHIY
jgi:uncharacterized membrane protein YkvA (DUF1232 family)